MATKFKLDESARSFFSDMRRKNDFSTDFDIYYFCLMAGLFSGRKGDVSSATEFVDYFPENYKERSKLIVGSFVASELEKSGVPYAEKKRVHAEIRNLIDPLSPTLLSQEGVHEMNRFVAGGLDYLLEEFADKPRSLDEFLIIFAGVLEENGG